MTLLSNCHGFIFTHDDQLHWDTYRNLIQRRKVVEQRLHQGRTRPVPERISQSSLEAQLIWKYLGCEPPIHFRRTLDQFGYPNLRSTVARDDDQMLWKRTRKLARIDDQLRKYLEPPPGDTDESEFMDGKVLMVDQLWLWIVDQKTVVTFFPNQEATTSEGKMFEQSNLHNSIYNELNGDLARRFETAGDLAALIMLHAVTVLLGKTLHRDLQVLRIFEESISILVYFLHFVLYVPADSCRLNPSPSPSNASVIAVSPLNQQTITAPSKAR